MAHYGYRLSRLRGLINFNLRALIGDIHIRKAGDAFMFYERKEPGSWEDRKSTSRHRWATPLNWIEWNCERLVYHLSQWSFLELLDLGGRFTVLVAVIFYFCEADERHKGKIYQSWAVINSAQGKGGSGGRIKALETLSEDGESLDGVDLAEAWLHEIQLPKASLRNANFEGAELWNANLQESKLQNTKLQRAELWDAKLKQAELQDAKLQSSKLRGADLREAKLYGADLRDADLSSANFKSADLSGAYLEGASLREANLEGAILWGTNLQGANLLKANLKGTDFRGANLAGSNLWKANLKGANLLGANLQDANLSGANLEGAELWEANLHGADLTNLLGITCEQITKARSDDSTEYHDSLRRCFLHD